MLDFFKKIIDYFNQNDIPYMLSGSIAMSIYIIPRATKDIDFVVQLRPSDIEGLIEYFDEGYYCNKEAVIDAVDRKGMFNIIDHKSGFKADFMIMKNEEYRLVEFERRKKINYFDEFVYIVSPEDLLLSKLIWIQEWQAAIQLEDIKNLSELSILDKSYISFWVKKLQLNTFNLWE